MSNVAQRSNRVLIVATIMLATFMVAIEATIVATAMPRIVGQLGGFSYYSWVFSAFLLAQSTTTVIYGKLSDIFGRKPVLIGGILIFLVGSLLCGLAWSMMSLVLFRLLQGLGAGAIQPVTMTVIGDLFKLEERGRVQGAMATVWATSAVVGPLAGGIIVDNISWAWIFWINLPIGIISIIAFMIFLKEDVAHKQAKIDYLGSVLFSISIVALLVMLTETDASAWILLSLFAVFVVAGILFLAQEKRAPEPIISIPLWSRRLIATSNAATLLAGMALIGLSTILPIYVQGVLGRSPVVAGFTLTMLVVGWPLAVMLSSRFYKAFGIRRTLRVGSLLFPFGACFLLFLTPESSPVVAGAGSFFMGFGMGLISLTSIVLVQDSVEWSMRGSATASIIFARSLGNTLGATVLGAILNAGINHYASGEAAAGLHDALNQPTGLSALAADPAIRAVFNAALHWSFWGVVVVAVLTFFTTWLIPVGHSQKREGAAVASEAASH
ncbi:MDR family MFS transporter [Rhizobium leguminosarum]|uniref:MFS transporter n=1 Tax=Rhizobium leguminosarum TaxID=384 RepID=A0A444HZH5_RHILE|nr:MDR family MFS transporter [Rhizobium leguminosarum]MDH6663328.1 EmrB/QacA subfamily drug resistance transporter [Rhizobium sophorae]ASS54609.1 MFS transporter [Rhizobium leguminosarum bv. viciae]MBB4332788.1 EmrB/QacA subfamily drug resistance transporter [Rhizobium leguminosarum]MBB4345713.1 EmrB/QacA subfamily drug resistance transporter [Rhizobium leguminosarum]MBB4358331.1 EmrB/QacA subfamily drug resistance transporter [Rhizobium leguminosarum]